MNTRDTVPARASEPRTRYSVWAGYAACAWGCLFAAISFYWGLGGTLGLDTIGGSIEKLGRAHDPTMLAAVWGTGFLKVLGALLAVALVHPWGRRLPRRPVLAMSWGAAVLLTGYGGVLVAVEALVASGAVEPRSAIDRTGLLWHLYLWDMSFLVWGFLFGVAAWHYTRTTGKTSADG